VRAWGLSSPLVPQALAAGPAAGGLRARLPMIGELSHGPGAQRSPARRQGRLRPVGSDGQLGSGSYNSLRVSDMAHPLEANLREEQSRVYKAIKGRADMQTQIARVGLGTIAEIATLPSHRSVRRARDELVCLGLIERDPRWGKISGNWRRSGHMSPEYFVPDLRELRPDILLAPLDPLHVDQAPVDEEVLTEDDHDRLQIAARALVVENLAARVRTALEDLEQEQAALWASAPRVGQMLVGRGIELLIREAEVRRVQTALRAGREPPRLPFPDTLRTRLEAVGGAASARDRNRSAEPELYQEALRARTRWVDGARAVLGAITAAFDVLAQIELDQPRAEDWRKTVADTRMALYLTDTAVRLAGQVEAPLVLAEAAWGRLRKPPAPPLPASPEAGADPNGPRPEPGRNPWWPPKVWVARHQGTDERSWPGLWRAMRKRFEAAKANRAKKALGKMRKAGFREDWPDPPA